MWLTPEQFSILTLSENYNDFAHKISSQLRVKGITGLIDDRAESIGRKIRDAELKKIPYMLIIGEKEFESGQVSVRKLGRVDLGAMDIETFAQHILEEIGED